MTVDPRDQAVRSIWPFERFLALLALAEWLAAPHNKTVTNQVSDPAEPVRCAPAGQFSADGMRAFSMASLAPGEPVSVNERPCVVVASWPGVHVDDMGNLFDGFWVEARPV